MKDYSWLEYLDTDFSNSLAKDIVRKILVSLACDTNLSVGWDKLGELDKKAIIKYWLDLAHTSIRNRIGGI
jgi:hypothetical protein